MKFRPCHPHEVTGRTRRNLPHWQQRGGCYFITFRLADSLPQALLRRWNTEREDWLDRHPEPWSEDDDDEYHELFIARRERWLDAGYGKCYLRQRDIRRITEASLWKFDGIRSVLDSYVVMPNHIHLIWQLDIETDLSRELHGLKGGSARACNRALHRNGTFWMDESYDRLVRDADELIALRNYIAGNPAKASLSPHEFSLATPFSLDL